MTVAASIYERLPYGLVVVDEQGNVVSANPAAVEMGWRSGAEQPPTACGEMFSCQVPEGPCHHGCLVRRAVQSPRRSLRSGLIRRLGARTAPSG
jgi:PAS domain-containing protein